MARARDADWRVDHRLWIEAFVIANFAGLVVDIYLAHSANAFRRAAEYEPLYFSAAARGFLRLCAVVLGVQALVGVVGFALHPRAVVRQPGPAFFEKLLTGAPPLAPLLFPNLVVLGLIGLWVLGRALPPDAEPRGRLT